MNYELISLAIGICLCVVVALCLIISANKRSKTKEEIINFLEGLADSITLIVVETIDSFDPKEYADAIEFETVTLAKIYEAVWNYIQEEIVSKYNGDKIISALLNKISMNDVIRFIDSLISKNSISIVDVYGSTIMENSNIEEEDKELEKEYSDQNIYIEESDNSKLAPAALEVPTEEELSDLNPQREEDEAFDPDDESMEPVDYILKTSDKNGKPLFYEIDETGRKKRVTKEYVAACGKEIREE